MKRARGFTLLELMIVVIVISILAALAISSYQKQVRKSRRADAKSTLGDYALKLEKWRTNNVNYGVDGTTALSNIGGSATSPGKYYTIAISFPSGSNCAGGQAKGNLNSFTITATAQGDQLKDTACPTIVWTNDCGQAPAKTPADCW
jgi:type IV pilus assembly protein PilE